MNKIHFTRVYSFTFSYFCPRCIYNCLRYVAGLGFGPFEILPHLPTQKGFYRLFSIPRALISRAAPVRTSNSAKFLGKCVLCIRKIFFKRYNFRNEMWQWSTHVLNEMILQLNPLETQANQMASDFSEFPVDSIAISFHLI